MPTKRPDPHINTRKALARQIYPIYKQAQLQAMAADAGTSLRWLLYFLKTSSPRGFYRSVRSDILVNTLNHLSDYYEQGKRFYVGSKTVAVNLHKYTTTGIRVKIIHPPKQNINFLRDLSTQRYTPSSYKDQKVL